MTGRAPDPLEHPSPAGHPGLPRWVTVLVLVAAIAVAVLVVTMLLVGGGHGPGRHGG